MFSFGDFTEFLAWEASSRDTIDLKKIYIDMTAGWSRREKEGEEPADLIAGLILSQIVYWNLPKKNGDSRLQVEQDGHFWLAKSYDSWWEECRVSFAQARRAIDILVKRELIFVETFKFDGTPTLHIRINEEKFMQEWRKCICATAQVGLRHSANTLAPQRKSLTETTAETTAKTTPPNGGGAYPGFFAGDKKHEASPAKQWATAAVQKLLNAYGHHLLSKPDAAGWERELEYFYQGFPGREKIITSTLDWYVKHWDDAYVPDARSASGFIQKFERIAAAKRRWEKADPEAAREEDLKINPPKKTKLECVDPAHYRVKGVLDKKAYAEVVWMNRNHQKALPMGVKGEVEAIMAEIEELGIR